MCEILKDYPDVLFGCESAAAESYIPNLLFNDNRFNLNYRTGRPVPVYAYLFHEYINNFMGNQVCTHLYLDHIKSPVNILERFAYAFKAGDMFTLVLNENGDINWSWGRQKVDFLPNQENIKTFIKNANAWRQSEAKKFIHCGMMVREYKVNCDYNRIYTLEDTYIDCDKIYTSAWEAKDGSFGQFLINYNDEDVECVIDLPDNEFILKRSVDGKEEMIKGKTNIKLDKLSVALIVKK